MEYLDAEEFELVVNVASDDKKSNIILRHLSFGVITQGGALTKAGYKLIDRYMIYN